jgi:uncharacterized coiled-coil DUF342 family protein/SAM-dependent methyltransferase
MTEPSSLEPSIALAAYAEPLASNRRVLVFGNALASLSLQLLERGARSVHVCDADAVRASEASARNRSTQISFSSLAESDLSLRDGSFELALVDNLGAFNALALLRTAKRALSSRGVAVIACPNPEAAFPLLRSNAAGATSLDYYALYDAVAAEFEHVRMLGQTPFVGYAIADFSASGEPEPALDTSFVPGGAEEPDSFIALASNHEVRLDEFAVIQLPTRRMLGSIGVKAEAPAPPAPPASTAKDAELARLNQWLKELESRASTADERADHAETELEELRPQLDTGRQALVSLKAQQDGLKAQHDGLKAQHDGLKAQHDKEVSALRAELSALRTQATNLRAESSSHVNEVARLKTELAERDQQLAAQVAKADQGEELAEFERQLVERGGELRRLEQDLRTSERTGRELVRELARRSGEQATQGSAELERALAEREADLQAAAWTIESLSLRLELAGKAPLDPANGGVEGTSPESALPNEEAR